MQFAPLVSFHVLRLLEAASKKPKELPRREEPQHFDNRSGIGPVDRPLFYKHKGTGVMLPFKGAPFEVPAEEKEGVCAHITGIEFGTSRRARRFWLDQIQQGVLSTDLLARYGEEPAEQAERLALHQRFWKTPYHWLGLLCDDILYNNDLSRYTYAGNGSNRRYVQVAAECHMPGLEKNRKSSHTRWDARDIEVQRRTLELAVLDARGKGAPCRELTAHRVYSKGRVGDPGELWWREVGRPMMAQLDLYTRYDHAPGGFHICREWDPKALYDYRGRRI